MVGSEEQFFRNQMKIAEVIPFHLIVFSFLVTFSFYIPDFQVFFVQFSTLLESTKIRVSVTVHRFLLLFLFR